MAINFSTVVYLPAFDTFSRAVTFMPRGGAAFVGRGILDTRGTAIETDAGMAVLSDQETILDVRDSEFVNLGREVPVQGDQLDIPAEGAIPAAGLYEVIETAANGGGETTLTIRKMKTAAP